MKNNYKFIRKYTGHERNIETSSSIEDLLKMKINGEVVLIGGSIIDFNDISIIDHLVPAIEHKQMSYDDWKRKQKEKQSLSKYWDHRKDVQSFISSTKHAWNDDTSDDSN